MFVDSHAHLDGKQFDSDREQVIARAREATELKDQTIRVNIANVEVTSK